LPSLTFIHPSIWEYILKIKFTWLNGSYWSLWPEVQFYFIAATLYFFNKKNFFRNILAVTLLMILEDSIPIYFPFFYHWNHLNQVMNISYLISYFTLGVIFHHLYKRHPIGVISMPGFCVAFISLYLLYAEEIYPTRIIYLVMVILFLLMIYKRGWLYFLENPLFRRIGVISYSVYLAHEYIGVLLINKYGGFLGRWSPLSVLIALILIILLAELSYRFVEQKVARLLKKLLFKPKISAGIPTVPLS
jgi:peptidoglycan/LPS O-acetylase OafA/YrhL